MEYVRLPLAKRVLVVGHRHPDGDSLACCVAVCRHYTRQGVEAKMWICGEVPSYLQWMPDLAEQESDPFSSSPDLLIILDTPALQANLGFDFQKLQKSGTKVIAIDHHADRRIRKPVYLSRRNIPRLNQTLEQTEFVEIVQPHKVSTASILIDYFGMKEPILYVGMRTDSGNFTRDTLECMRLVTRLCITNDQIQEYHRNMKPRPKPPKVLQHLKANGIQPISGKQGELHLMGIEEDSKEIAKQTLGILRMFFPNVGVVWKSGMSLRSEDVDVSSIADSLGGGGHSRAAGSSEVSVNDMPLILETIRSCLDVPGSSVPAEMLS